ncbi:SPla/RYanodine receptor (SPRY) domain-containing protein [Actinidia rufa]|uniref:SPla/RYanodine receptor (SPRY) domain-containing protein n=1 Tax=Actinidia rufa TaxID=165716 RepID=A0A7J0GG11_9ERIC|nr:SPla/RYanodine receptor (SPRY) domain-containing protein [Actinidia rufa]
MVNNHQDLIGSYFLGLWKQNSGNPPPSAEDEEEAPTELNTINTYGGFLNVFPDKLSVQYTSVNLHGHDVGVVQANRPAPVKRLLYYFEIYVKNAGAKGQIAIGFTAEGFNFQDAQTTRVNHIHSRSIGFVLFFVNGVLEIRTEFWVQDPSSVTHNHYHDSFTRK